MSDELREQIPAHRRIDLAEDEFLLHVTDPVIPDWKVGQVGETKYEGRTVATVITEVWADGWFKLRRVPGRTADDDVRG